ENFGSFMRWRSAISPSILCSIGLISAIVKASSGSLSEYGRKRAAFRMGDSVRLEVTDAILRHGHDSNGAIEAHAAFVVRIRDVERGIDEGLLSALRSAAELLPLLVALVVMSSGLALWAIVVLSPFALLLSFARKRFRLRHKRAARLAEELHAGL